MSNNGTPYDRYPDGCWCCGGMKYTRSKRESFAIAEGLEDWESYWDWRSYDNGCYCGGLDPDDLCVICTHPDRGSDRLGKKPDHNHPVEKWEKAPKPTPECEHVWIERERWLPSDHGRGPYGYWHYDYPAEMVLHRVWNCVSCRAERVVAEVKVRQDLKPQHGRRKTYQLRRSVRVTRPMEKNELVEFEKRKAKRDRWPVAGGTPKSYGEHEDGSPIRRYEFKQAPKKRLTRKREDA